MASGSLVSCLICGNGLEEQKPMVDSESVEKFKGAFHTFCKLLNVNEEEVVEEFLDGAISVMEESPHDKDPLEELDEVAFGVACCGECFGALKDLERLEKAIEEMKAAQMGHLEGLKVSLISAAVKYEGRDDDWGLTRRRFLSCIPSTNFCDTPDPPPIHPAKVECILSSPEDDAASLEETGHAETFEDDEKPISLPPSPSSSPPPDLHSISPPPKDPLVDAVNTERKRRQISEVQLGKRRQAKTPRLTPSMEQETPYISAAQQEYVQYIQPDPLSLSRESSKVLPENSRRSRKSAPILRNMAEEPYELIVSGSDNEDNGDSSDNFVPSSSEGESEEDESEEDVSGSRHEDSFPKRQAASTKKPPKKKERSKATVTPKVTRRRGVKRKLNNLFYQVNENTLLYKFSLIQVSHGGTQLKCLEQNCSVLFQDLDSLSLFEKMAAHLDQDHEGSTAIKSCPFPDCQAWFPSSQGPDFRSHLLILHKVDHVLCEICWKPIRGVVGTHSNHKWYHRNEQEKREVPPPVVVLKMARKCKEGKYGWLADMAVDATDTARWSVTKNENCSKLSDSLLLYKFTLIKVVPGQGFCCEEPGCTSTTFLANGTDFQAFEQVRVHVKSCHVAPAKGKVYAKMPRECPLCLDRNVLSGGAFRSHVLSEHGYMPFICQCCWKPVKCEKLLRDHMERHLSLEEREERGLSRDPLNQLSEAVSSKNPARKKFICGVCGKAFSKSYPLRTHQQTHLPPEQRKIWSCEQCSKTFALASTLQSHVESVLVAPHLKRIRSCPICDKQFPWNDKNRFQVHMRQHTNERPFVCEICGKTFGGEVNLKLHLKGVHTEDRKFQCEFCQISYKSVRNLRRHQLARHKDHVTGKDHEKSLLNSKAESKPGFIGPKIAFPCEICEKVFPLKCRLTQHVKKYHSN